jgi:hypothetical protein
MTKTFKQFINEVTLQTWKKQLQKDHGTDVKIWKDKHHNRTIGEHPVTKKILGSYDHKAKNGTVFAPEKK